MDEDANACMCVFVRGAIVHHVMTTELWFKHFVSSGIHSSLWINTLLPASCSSYVLSR